MKEEKEFTHMLEEKLSEMEASSYTPPKRFSRNDYIITALVAAVCLILVLWGAVCAEIFASSMMSLLDLFGIHLPQSFHILFSLLCVALGTLIALHRPAVLYCE